MQEEGDTYIDLKAVGKVSVKHRISLLSSKG